jgi:SAM-dependent methyltransferase
MTAARRKELGSWYTPHQLVDHIVNLVAAGVPRRGPVTIIDPSCGDGRFLASAARTFGTRAQLVGVDLDPAAVANAKRNVPNADIFEADALTFDWSNYNADIVVGNPPYLNQLEKATARPERSLYGGGPYSDVAADFLALAVDITRPGGRVGLVLPQSILATRDVGPIRTRITEQSAVIHSWWTTERIFDAHVHTCALIIERGTPQGPVERTYGMTFEPRPDTTLANTWGTLILDNADLDIPQHHDGPTLGDIATFTVDFRDVYYGLAGCVTDNGDGPPLVTSGLIEPGRCLWGQQPVKFAKQRYNTPHVNIDQLNDKLQRWAHNRLQPKILIANQTRLIEAVIDEHGAWLPSVPVLTCTAPDLEQVAAILAADTSNRWVRYHGAGSGLTPNVTRLTPALLSQIPLHNQ